MRGGGSVSGDMTRTAVLAVLARQGSLSRAEVAERLGLSPATVTTITRRLVADGPVCSCGNRGCPETQVSTESLLRRAAELGIVAPDAELDQLGLAAEQGRPA